MKQINCFLILKQSLSLGLKSSCTFRHLTSFLGGSQRNDPEGKTIVHWVVSDPHRVTGSTPRPVLCRRRSSASSSLQRSPQAAPTLYLLLCHLPGQGQPFIEQCSKMLSREHCFCLTVDMIDRAVSLDRNLTRPWKTKTQALLWTLSARGLETCQMLHCSVFAASKGM